MTWLDGFEQKAASTEGGTFDGSPWRLVLHTTEGSSIEGAIASFAKTGSWPHFTVDAGRGRKIQHYPLSTSARALAHPKGSPETNRAGAIQIEIVGFANDSPDRPLEELDWLGREVVAPIRFARPFPLTFPTFVGPEAGTIASARAPQRLTWDAWAAFSGICGHQHVPGNDHWDPGRLDVARIVVAAMDPNQPAPPPKDDDMPAKLYALPFDGPKAQRLKVQDRGLVAAIPSSGARPWWIPSNDALALERQQGAVEGDPTVLNEPASQDALLALVAWSR